MLSVFECLSWELVTVRAWERLPPSPGRRTWMEGLSQTLKLFSRLHPTVPTRFCCSFYLWFTVYPQPLCLTASALLDHIWVPCWTVMSLNISVKPKQIVKGKGLKRFVNYHIIVPLWWLNFVFFIYLITYLSSDWKLKLRWDISLKVEERWADDELEGCCAGAQSGQKSCGDRCGRPRWQQRREEVRNWAWEQLERMLRVKTTLIPVAVPGATSEISVQKSTDTYATMPLVAEPTALVNSVWF